MIRRAAIIVFLFTWTLTTHGKYSASGDEPHYLMMAHSIVVDHDLDVGNNYADNDGRFFGHDHLEMGLHAVRARSGRLRPIHDVGLGVAIAPVYAAARQIARLPSDGFLRRVRMDRGLFTYSVVSLCLAALTAVGMALLGHALTAFVSPLVASFLLVLIGISPPVVSHAFLVFPEVIALFATCVVLWFSFQRDHAAGDDGGVFKAIILLLGALPWFHHKYLVYTPALLSTLLWMRWPLVRRLSPAARTAAALLFVLPQAALLLYTWREWGTLGGALTTEQVPFSTEMLKSGFAGLLIDRVSGLLAYAPLYVVVPACVFLAWKTIVRFAAPALTLYIPAAAFTIGWWAGFSPAARYITPLIPFFAVAIAAAWRHRTIRIATVALAAPQLVIDLIVWQHPRLLWPADGAATNVALHSLGPVGRAYEGFLPALQRDGLTDSVLWMALVVGAVTLVLAVFSGRETRRRNVGVYGREDGVRE